MIFLLWGRVSTYKMLSQDNLFEIFSNLDGEELLKCCKVCPEWERVVFSTSLYRQTFYVKWDVLAGDIRVFDRIDEYIAEIKGLKNLKLFRKSVMQFRFATSSDFNLDSFDTTDVKFEGASVVKKRFRSRCFISLRPSFTFYRSVEEDSAFTYQTVAMEDAHEQTYKRVLDDIYSEEVKEQSEKFSLEALKTSRRSVKGYTKNIPRSITHNPLKRRPTIFYQ